MYCKHMNPNAKKRMGGNVNIPDKIPNISIQICSQLSSFPFPLGIDNGDRVNKITRVIGKALE